MAGNHEHIEEQERWELRGLNGPELRDLYERELKKTFPPAELKPLASMEALRDKGRYEALGLFRGAAFQGYALMWADREGKYPLLDYLGVPEEARGRGQGTRLLKLLRARYPNAKGVIAEAEAPKAAVNEAERALRERRLRFYDHSGFVVLPFDTGLFGVHYKVLLCPNGPIDASEALEVHRRRYQEHFKPEHFEKFVQIPLKEGEPVRQFSASRWP